MPAPLLPAADAGLHVSRRTVCIPFIEQLSTLIDKKRYLHPPRGHPTEPEQRSRQRLALTQTFHLLRPVQAAHHAAE